MIRLGGIADSLTTSFVADGVSSKDHGLSTQGGEGDMAKSEFVTGN